VVLIGELVKAAVPALPDIGATWPGAPNVAHGAVVVVVDDEQRVLAVVWRVVGRAERQLADDLFADAGDPNRCGQPTGAGQPVAAACA
jgi:hypothetical protein